MANLDGRCILLGTTPLKPSYRTPLFCCHPSNEQAMDQPNTDTAAFLYARLLHPFVDVFCFYAYTFRDLNKIARHIELWMQDNRQCTRPKNLPRMIIVLHGSSWMEKQSEARKHFFSSLPSAVSNSLTTSFSELKLMVETKRSPIGVESILREVESVRQTSQAAGLLFSVKHFNALFERFFSALSHHPQTFIQSAREDFPVSSSLGTHMTNFLQLVPKPADLELFAVETIASALLLDNYPPSMHGSTLPEPQCPESH